LDVLVDDAVTNAGYMQVRQEGRQFFRGYHYIEVSARSSWFFPEVEAWAVSEIL